MANGGGGRQSDTPKNRSSVKRAVGRSATDGFQIRILRRTAIFIRRLGWRRTLLATLLLTAFSGGFYLASVYTEISELIAQRRAALTSAIYSAPLVITDVDELGPLHVLERIQPLSSSPMP